MEQVIISSYNAEWMQDYEHEQKKIRYSFESLPVFLEHIGSSAVPGMDSKPTIDMMAGVEELSLVNETIIQRLDEIGYEYVHKPEFPERLFFEKENGELEPITCMCTSSRVRIGLTSYCFAII